MTTPLIFEPEALGADGWTDWIKPLPGYVLQCCDCGSLHKMQFRVEGECVAFRAKPIEPAIAMEAAKPSRRETGSTGTATARVRKDIAQTQSGNGGGVNG